MDAWHIMLAAYIQLLHEYMYYPMSYSSEQVYKDAYPHLGLTSGEAEDWLRKIISGDRILVLDLHSPRKDGVPPGVGLQEA